MTSIFGRHLTGLSAVGVLIMVVSGTVAALSAVAGSQAAGERKIAGYIRENVIPLVGGDTSRYEGKLVYASATPQPLEDLKDGDLGLAFHTVRLERESQIYQWGPDGQGRPVAHWMSDRNPGYDRGPERNHGIVEYPGIVSSARAVTFGQAMLDPYYIAFLKVPQKIDVTAEGYAALPEPVRKRYALVDGSLVEPGAPGIGDNRMRFKGTLPAQVTVIGEYSAGTIRPKKTDFGTVALLRQGEVPIGEIEDDLDRKASDGAANVVSAALVGVLLGAFVIVADMLRKHGNNRRVSGWRRSSRAAWRATVVVPVCVIAASSAIWLCGWNLGDFGRHYVEYLAENAVDLPENGDLASYEGRIVVASGTPKGVDQVGEPDFSFRLPLLRLERESQIFQWIESGGKFKTYATGWSDEPVSSGLFPSEYENAGIVEFPAYRTEARSVELGNVRMDPAYIGGVGSPEAVPVTPEMYSAFSDALKARYVTTATGSLIAADHGEPRAPLIGDNRIHWKGIYPAPVTIVGILSGGTVRAVTLPQVGRLAEVFPGVLTKREVMSRLSGSYERMTGYVEFFAGLAGMFGLVFLLGTVIRGRTTRIGHTANLG